MLFRSDGVVQIQAGIGAHIQIDAHRAGKSLALVQLELDALIGLRGGTNPGDGGGNVPVEHRKKLSAISAASVRNVVRNKTTGEYTIVFTPASSATNGILEVFMSAESQNYEASIVAASCSECPDLKFDKNRITNLVFTEKKAIRLNIQLDYHDYCSLEVKAYGNQV